MWGTWAAWGGGRTPVGVNTADTSFNTVEKTGGEKRIR
ncbi:MAG: phage baseplate protein [Acutalibacteraceae bacterium]